MRPIILLVLFGALLACGKDARTKSESAADNINAAGKSAMPRTDYDAIAEEACQKSGGTCAAKSACGPDVGVELPNICRPGVPGLTCCRKPATECPGYETATCCRKVDGRLTNSGAFCDRGYPTCLGFSDEYSLSADRQCTRPLAEASKDAENRWAGTMGAQAAGQWACSQAGGKQVTTRQQCDGYLIALSAEPCCIPRALCPEQREGTECCKRDGSVYQKECVAGHAVCPAGLLGLGSIREVPAGTCAAF